MLPIRQLRRAEFDLGDGVIIEYRELSRAEALQLRGLSDDVALLEIRCIATATGTTEDEARAWHEATPQKEVENFVNAIAELSGLNGDSGKDDAGNSHSANLTELITSLQKISDALLEKSEPSEAAK